MISGSVFPPSTCFSIDVVPGSNTAIIFGGVLKDQKERDTNDVFILSYTKNSVVRNSCVPPIVIINLQYIL